MDRPGAHSILILEDEPLIALDLEQIVAEAGFVAVSTFTTRQNAKIWLTAQSPDVALIDIFLEDDRCSDVALALKERGVPFIVCSASAKRDAEDIFRTGVWLSKPFLPRDVIGALREVRHMKNDGRPHAL